MYLVTCIIQGEEIEIYNPLESELLLESPVLEMEMGKAGSFSFSVPVSHPHREKIKPLASEINVYRDGVLLFSGRPLTNDEDFRRTGKINCEGDLAYLIDSIQRPYEYTGSIKDFISQCLTVHNNQVEDRKKIYVGNVTVIDSNNYINRSASEITNTFDTLTKKLVDTHGGYFRVRHSDGNRYLDYVTDYGGINNQVIRFGENLVDMTQKVDPSTIVTALIPEGAEVGEGVRLDIKSVNGGLDYIYSPEGVAEYGWIWGVQRWDDVTIASNLLTKARAYLNECILLPKTLELKAIDLSLLDVSIDELKLGYWTKVESAPHGISADFMLSKMRIDLANPANNEIVLGKTVATFTGSTTKQMLEKVDKVASSVTPVIKDAVQSATDIITGGKGGYIVIERSNDGNPEELLIMDAPSKANAKNVLRLNKNGLGFSKTGIDGPYNNAWTIDGKLVADFITSGTMLADRIRGGVFELGGANNTNGTIKILNANGQVIGAWNNVGIELKAGESTVLLSNDSGEGLYVSGKSKYVYSGETVEKTLGVKIDKYGIKIADTLENLDFVINEEVDVLCIDSGGMNIYDENGETIAHYDNQCSTETLFVTKDGAVITGYSWFEDDLDVCGELTAEGDVTIIGDLNVKGEKNRIVETSYGTVRLSAYELTTPMFGDIGSGEIGKDGKCKIHLDEVFSETVNTDLEYHVFLQSYSESPVWVSDKKPKFFVVSGEPGKSFAWEIKAKQKGYEENRLVKKEKKQKKEKPKKPKKSEKKGDGV